jgi:nucleolin
MSSSEEANKAKEALNGSTLDGRTIKVDLARPMKQGGRGFGGGGFGGGGFNRGGGFKRSGFRGDR